MKIAKVLACCLLVLPLVGTARRSVSKTRAKTLNTAGQRALRAPLEAELRHDADLFRAGGYQEAQLRFESLHQSAARAGLHDLALRATSNVGGCQFALHQYRKALGSFLDARRLAANLDDSGAVFVLDANIASLYAALGEPDAGAAWLKSVLVEPVGSLRPQEHAKLLIQMAAMRAEQGRMEEAVPLFRKALDAAVRAGDLELYAMGCNRLGEELLKQGDLAHAEPPLLEAYRIRKLHRFALDTSYRSLGRLRLEQGDLPAASALLDRAVELAERPGGVLPAWNVYYYRGRVRLAGQRLGEALRDLRLAVRLGRAWRWSAPADDAGRVGAEQWLQQVHSALIEAANRLYLKTGDTALIRETFEAAEENRASSLRALLEKQRAPELQPAYWEALVRLQRAEVNALRSPGAPAEEAVSAARAELIRLQASDPPGGSPLSGDVLESFRAALPGDTALLSFHLGDSISWLWTLDRRGLSLHRLPPRREIETRVQGAAEAIRDDAPYAGAAGAALYGELFGGVAQRIRQKARWLLALDAGLFDAPFAALPESRAGRGTAPRMIERRALEVIPGAGVWLDAAARRRAGPPSGLFLGVGDPVYNPADPRAVHAPLRRNWPFTALAATAGDLAIPRLVASGTELDVCARAWGGERVLLKGAEASGRRLEEQLRRKPAAIHFATHILLSSGKPSYGMIALSLSGRGGPEMLPPAEIAHWKIDAALVALSGCHSAAGEALPGAGLMGLTRAWIAAGARTVVASRWSMPDEQGALFGALYRKLKSQASWDSARALRAAQLEMLHTPGWRSRPRYWGAYFTVGVE